MFLKNQRKSTVTWLSSTTVLEEKKIDLNKRMLNEYKALSRFCCGAHLYPLQTQYADQLLVGLLTQLVERCTGIAEDMGSNPVQA